MKNILLAIAVFVITTMLTAGTVAAVDHPSKEESRLWELIKNTRDIEELDIYLETYPDGEWVDQVRTRKWTIVKSEQNIEQIEAYVRDNPQGPYLKDAEDTIWQLVTLQNSIPVLRDYIKKYPQSRYLKEAEDQILHIEEKNSWLVVKKANTMDHLKLYIEKNPKSRYLAEAREMLWHLVKKSNDIDVLNDYADRYPGTKLAYKAREMVWQIVDGSDDIYTTRKFLELNPDSRFRGLAKLKLHRLRKRAATLEISDTLIFDRITHLVWQRTDLGNETWLEASEKCSGNRLRDWEDWRLPSKDELASLFNIKHFIPDFTFTHYWTGTTYAKDEQGAWMISFKLPRGNIDYKKNTHHALCVRSFE
ncbi:MAG: DUF1566 domain-containing protein [bacterium]